MHFHGRKAAFFWIFGDFSTRLPPTFSTIRLCSLAATGLWPTRKGLPTMIKNGTVVSMTYCLTNASGEELDRADHGEPFSYLHGSGQIVPGLEAAMVGMLVGSKKKVVIEPAEAYGELDEKLRTTVDRSNFPPDQDLEIGMQFAADVGEDERIVFTVTGIEGDKVHIDGNHPLAGETLHFDVEVLGMREATKEEIAHGHAHGPDGHHHH